VIGQDCSLGILNSLLLKNLDPNQPEKWNKTKTQVIFRNYPLHYAITHHLPEHVELLLQHSAKIYSNFLVYLYRIEQYHRSGCLVVCINGFYVTQKSLSFTAYETQKLSG
jgi:hypothetical protein